MTIFRQHVVLVSPFCRKMRNGQRNPKEYPWWPEVVQLLKEKEVDTEQLAVKDDPDLVGCTTRHNDLSATELRKIIEETNTWLSCDSFLPHFVNAYKLKPGVVVWGKSDPRVFGYMSNKNLLRDERCLREHQFNFWEEEQYDERVFVRPNVVAEAALSLLE